MAYEHICPLPWAETFNLLLPFASEEDSASTSEDFFHIALLEKPFKDQAADVLKSRDNHLPMMPGFIQEKYSMNFNALNSQCFHCTKMLPTHVTIPTHWHHHYSRLL
jgi:hypothetical protein